jgi:nitrous oxide reductase
MIETDGKAMEEVCATLHMTIDQVHNAQRDRNAQKSKSIANRNAQKSKSIANRIMYKTINDLLNYGISLLEIKEYLNVLDASNTANAEPSVLQPDFGLNNGSYYAVARGHIPGVYTTWDEAKAQIIGYNGVRQKKFKTREEAELFIASHQD